MRVRPLNAGHKVSMLFPYLPTLFFCFVPAACLVHFEISGHRKPFELSFNYDGFGVKKRG